MIVVSVTPRRLVVGQRARVDIRFSNVSTGPCRNIVFTLEVPSGLRLIGGGDRIHIAAIGPDTEVVRSVLVEATQAGDYRLTSPNFSYRDEDDDSVRNRDWLVVLTAVEPAPVMQPVERPAPRLRVEWAGGALEIGRNYSASVSGLTRLWVWWCYAAGSSAGGIQAWPLKRSRRASSLPMPHFPAVDR